jgi:hypothetical protein
MQVATAACTRLITVIPPGSLPVPVWLITPAGLALLFASTTPEEFS